MSHREQAIVGAQEGRPWPAAGDATKWRRQRSDEHPNP
jgi:hypothetical protein